MIHARVLLSPGSAWSILFKITILGFPPVKIVEVRVPAGLGYSGVDYLADSVNRLHIRCYHSPCLCHVAWKPLNIHLYAAASFHRINTHSLSCSKCAGYPQCRCLGIIIRYTLPNIALSSIIPISAVLLSVEAFLLSPMTKTHPSGTVTGPMKVLNGHMWETQHTGSSRAIPST